MVAKLRLATRGSPLAREQANLVGARLAALDAVDVELVIVQTSGDSDASSPIAAFSGRGVFTSEVEFAVLDGRADVAVHSAKDLPTQHLPEGLVLVAVPERADVRDALVGRALSDLVPGATVASGSIRRRVQLAHLRPDLHFVELRGNIATRLSKVPANGAAVVAVAALERLGLAEQITEILDVDTMLPQVGQGALALRCRETDETTRALLVAIDDEVHHRCVTAERAFLAELGGGCNAPLGAYATVDNVSNDVVIEAMIASMDGVELIRRRAQGDDAARVGIDVARRVLDEGGRAIAARY